MRIGLDVARLFIIAIVTATAGLGAAPPAAAQDRSAPSAGASEPASPPPPGLVQLGDVENAVLLLKTVHPGHYLTAPTVAADVEMDVTGPIIRTRVTQRFENPSDQWVEGTYTFPLPENAAVDRLRLMVGDRFIEGQIKERAEARRVYEQARREGRRAGLVEQQRPNMFTNSVANIGPGETVVVQIEYQETARLNDGVFSLRFPMVVGPRYIPQPDLIQTVDFDGGSGLSLSDPVPDADAITPPVLDPAFEPGVDADGAREGDAETLRLPVFVRVNLRAGFPLGAVTSPYHDVDVERLDGARATVALTGAVPANRDFALEWRAMDGRRPQAALFKEVRDGDTYALAMVAPPAALSADAPRRPREAIFVIDNSGSMAGPSMTQAKQALTLALDRLQPEDTFNVVRFDDTHDQAFDAPVSATPENVGFAKGLVSQLEAEGGTEMLPALKAALYDTAPDDPDRVRQVVFLTDGAIGNEAELFQEIKASLGRSRLFTVGIGSAPNSYFMTRAARLGRGTFTHIGDVAEVAERAGALFAALERPVMTDLEADILEGRVVEIYPSPLPDLYDGEPVVAAVKLAGDSAQDATLRLSGLLGDTRWAADLDLGDAAEGSGVAAIWGRAKIADIEETRFEGAPQDAIDAGVLETALAFNLVSRRTSLVAVDVTPARPADEPLTPRDIATMLPAGWDFGAVFGEPAEAFVREAALDPTDPRLGVLRAGRDPSQVVRGPDGLPLPRGGLTDADRALQQAVNGRLRAATAASGGDLMLVTGARITHDGRRVQLLIAAALIGLALLSAAAGVIALRRKAAAKAATRREADRRSHRTPRG